MDTRHRMEVQCTSQWRKIFEREKLSYVYLLTCYAKPFMLMLKGFLIQTVSKLERKCIITIKSNVWITIQKTVEVLYLLERTIRKKNLLCWIIKVKIRIHLHMIEKFMLFLPRTIFLEYQAFIHIYAMYVCINYSFKKAFK